MQIKLKISIIDDNDCFLMGPGPYLLLEKIKEHKSINKAAKSMGLSYPKALKMINTLEKGLDDPVIIRTRGGHQRGGTVLTSYGERYIKRYLELEDEIKRFAEIEFDLFKKEIHKIKGKENE